MRNLCASAVFLMLVWSPVAASPGVVPSGILGGGVQLGSSDHPDGGGLAAGLHARADLQMWWLMLGGTAGVDGYPRTSAGVPIEATSVAAHLGVAGPIYQHRTRTRLHEIAVLAAVEIGRHHYSPHGGDGSGFDVLAATVSYDGPGHSVTFIGERAGLSYASIGFRADRPGVVFALEVVRRSDRHTVDLDYTRSSCGGLLTSGCTSSSGMATAGGRELAVVASVGLVIGR